MGRPGTHFDNDCYGAVHTTYIRVGEPAKLVKIGWACRRCMTFWPLVAPKEAKRAVQQALGDAARRVGS